MSQPYQSLSDAIKAFLEIHGLEDEVAIQRLINDWERIMGKQIAQRTTRLSFKNGIFFVTLDSPVWKNELQLGREKIRELLNREIGKELIKEVRLT